MTEGVFAKNPAEISYMDENNARWSYIDLKEGHMPQRENEIILDEAALELLGVTPGSGNRSRSPTRCMTRSKAEDPEPIPSYSAAGGSMIPCHRYITSTFPGRM